MKNVILTILRTGISQTKKYKSEDLIKKIPCLKYLIKDTEYGITCNDNDYWGYTNEDNQNKFIHEVVNIHNFNVKDSAYFNILNNMANGNKYGIKTNDEYIKISENENQKETELELDRE